MPLFADNRVTSTGVTSIAQILPKCIHLRNLDVSGNRLGDVGVTIIARALLLSSLTLLYVEAVGTQPRLRVEPSEFVLLLAWVPICLTYMAALMHDCHTSCTP